MFLKLLVSTPFLHHPRHNCAQEKKVRRRRRQKCPGIQPLNEVIKFRGNAVSEAGLLILQEEGKRRTGASEVAKEAALSLLNSRKVMLKIKNMVQLEYLIDEAFVTVAVPFKSFANGNR